MRREEIKPMQKTNPIEELAGNNKEEIQFNAILQPFEKNMSPEEIELKAKEIFANEEKKGIIDSAEEKYKRFKAFRSEGPLKSATAAVEKTVAEQSEAIDYTSEVARLNALLSQQLPKEVIADEIKKLNQNIRGLSKAQNISDADKKRLENELIEISNQLDFKFVNQK